MSLGKRVVLEGRLDAQKLGEKTTVYVHKEGKLYYAEIVVAVGKDDEQVLHNTSMFSSPYTAKDHATAWAKRNKQFIH